MSEHEHIPKKTAGKKPAQNEVAKKAYAIYLKEGRWQGRDVQNRPIVALNKMIRDKFKQRVPRLTGSKL
jgi:hypothetical protein